MPEAPHHHVPTRTCVSCRRARPKPELLRIVRTPDGVSYDPRQRLPGRGAYLCADPRCVEAAARREGHALRRALGAGRGSGPAPHDQVRAVLDRLREELGAGTDQHRRSENA